MRDALLQKIAEMRPRKNIQDQDTTNSIRANILRDIIVDVAKFFTCTETRWKTSPIHTAILSAAPADHAGRFNGDRANEAKSESKSICEEVHGSLR